ncbi:hypothetical protein BDK92_1653 [Micromonospora pisi]|uniref:Uncharacterized protein n=1 Tax=Micromonospora pisi TaxID=589240 RepID=A0A495JFQ4_9ACTN|nr:DUF6789 family protein [Micromonospora pisi]RKR87378.1 hypothetical protein BDK92_1653 [Micromonospora pisi]
MDSGRQLAAVGRAGARGAIAAMAMSGVRQATTSLGLVERTPPEQLLKHVAPALFNRVPVNRRPALVEFIHWSVGAFGGAAFGLLPRTVRRRAWVGPAYGFVFWAAFEATVAPKLGISRKRHGLGEQLALLVDHTLYGVVVGSSPWPHAD